MRKSGQLKVSLDIKAQQKLLRQNINTYQDPLSAAIRETLANAIDACEEAGSVEPVRIYTDEGQMTIHIEDRGYGMSEDFILEQFLSMASTTKDGSGQGSMGIGGKSPWAYTSTFYMSSTHQGATVKVTLVDVETDYLVESETIPAVDRPSGVIVSIPIKESDWGRATDLCKKYATLCTYPILLNEESFYEEPVIKYDGPGKKWWTTTYEGCHFFNRHIPIMTKNLSDFLGGICIDFSGQPMTPDRDRFIYTGDIDTDRISSQGLQILADLKETLPVEEYLNVLSKIFIWGSYWTKGFVFTNGLRNNELFPYAAEVSPHFSLLPYSEGNIFVNSKGYNFLLLERHELNRQGSLKYCYIGGSDRQAFNYALLPNNLLSEICATNLPRRTAAKRAHSLPSLPKAILVLEGASEEVMQDIYKYIQKLPEPPKKEKGSRKGTITPRDKVKDAYGKVHEKKDIDFYLTKGQNFQYSISAVFPDLTFITLSSPVKGVQSFHEYLLSHPDKLKTIFQKGVVKRFLESLPELILVGEDSVVLSQEVRRVREDQSYSGCATLSYELHYSCIGQQKALFSTDVAEVHGKTLFSNRAATDIPILDKDVKSEYIDTRSKVKRFLKYLGYEEDSIPQLEAMPWPQRPNIFNDIDYLRDTSKTFRSTYNKLIETLEIEETEDSVQQPS